MRDDGVAVDVGVDAGMDVVFQRCPQRPYLY